MKLNSYLLIFLSLAVLSSAAFGADELDFMDSEDEKILSNMDKAQSSIEVSELEEGDDLQSLRDDIGEIAGDLKTEENGEVVYGESKKITENKKLLEKKESDSGVIFDVGDEEKLLLEVAKKIEGRIPKKEWNEIALMAKQSQYTIEKKDTLWRVSKRFFGSGFYYSKVWSLNPQITNPHEIEPGMVLLFDTGSMDSPPNVSVGEFKEDKDEKGKIVKNGKKSFVERFELTNFGEDTTPKWLTDREKLVSNGHYFTYASEQTYDELIKLGNVNLVEEYKRYTPPYAEIMVREPGDNYDASGFDKNSKISFDYSEGFYLNTFVTTNIVQDLGVIANLRTEKSFVLNNTYIYVKFDADVSVKPGDFFSVYSADGKVTHAVSDRSGYRYTILAQIKAMRKINDKWECLVTDIAGMAQRGDRITVYTPKINQVVKTFSRRKIEAAIVDSYKKTVSGIHFGDVVYLDRGRADGIEMGNVFEIYSSQDKGTNRRITPDPTYVIGEATVISLTDNFATVLITNSAEVTDLGSIVISKTEQDAMNVLKVKQGFLDKNVKELENGALEELDVELNLDDISDDLLKKADQMKLTEDELDELERQEREKSIMKDHERDLKDLERMEGELENVEKQLNESKLDEDKLLEDESLEKIEGSAKKLGENAFESLDEIEKDIGKKYLDEDLNAKENPYGLTKYDVEEIEELLNSSQKAKKKNKTIKQ